MTRMDFPARTLNNFAKIHRALALALIASLPAGCFLGVESEAHRRAEEYVQRHLSKCGESFFSRDVIPRSIPGPIEYFYEFRGISVDFRGRDISKSEALNGLEYASVGEGLKIDAGRSAYRNVGSTEKLCWSEWETRGTYLSVSRKNGAWFFNSGVDSNVPIDCEFCRKILPCEKKP